MEKQSLPEKHLQDNKFLNALAEAFRLQEAILNTTDLPIISTTTDGVITSFNRAAEVMFGYAAAELIGKSNMLVFHDLEEVVRQSEELSQKFGTTIEPVFDVVIRKAQEQKTPVSSEWTMIRKNGTRFPAMLSVSALRDDCEALIGFVSIPTDLTEQKRIHQRTTVSEEKFRLLAENIPGVIYLRNSDETHSMIYVNDRVEEVTGYPAADFLSGKMNFAKLYHPEDAEMIHKKMEEALDKKQSFQLRYRIRHRSEEWRWLDEVGGGVYADGRLLMLEGFLSDITQQKLAEEKFQKIAEENLHVFNNPVNLNAVAGFDGYFKRLSPSWTRLLGWTEEELKSRSFF